MTEPSQGPSLLQARDPHSYAHSHPHSSSDGHSRQHEPEHQQDHPHSFHRHLGRHQHGHEHGHARAHAPARDSSDSGYDYNHRASSSSSPSPGQGHHDDDDNRHHGDHSGLDDHLQLRQAPASPASANALASSSPSLVTQVIQTVSLVQIVDPAGSPIETQTRYAAPNTIVVDSGSGKTVAISHPKPSSPAAPGPGGNGPASSPTDSTSHTLLSTSSQPSHTLSESDTASGTGQETVLTPAPSPPNASLYPTISGMHNGTNSAVNGNSSFVPTSNGSSFQQMAFSTPVTLSDPSASASASASASDSATESNWSYSVSDTILSSSHAATTTAASTSSFISTSADGSKPTSEPTSNDPTVLSPQQKQVIGGVVGGIAGAAIFVFLVMLALRYKRRRDGRRGMLGDGSSGTVTAGSGNGSGAPSGNTMVERSGPAAITAAWAGLTGKRNAPAAAPAETGERGFYRVSGRKLPSVFYAGGDGYTDPRASVVSGNSDYYRGSQAFDPVPDPVGGGSARLALGSPMRPVSGIPIMRSGPARTPVTEQNPFADPPTPPGQDGNGRSLGSRGSPVGSSSRFQESI